MKNKILIVDDDPSICSLLKNFFEMKGINVETVDNGYFALKRIREFKPDVVLLDIMIPRMDGYEVCAKIRDFEDDTSKTPIVIMSALNNLENVKKAIAYGANDYIIKPIKLDLILNKLQKYLDIKKEAVNKEDNVLIEVTEKTYIVSVTGIINDRTYSNLQRVTNNLDVKKTIIFFFHDITDVDVYSVKNIIEYISLLKFKEKMIAIEDPNLYSISEITIKKFNLKLFKTLIEAYEKVM